MFLPLLQPGVQHLLDALRRLAIPQLGDPAGLSAVPEHVIDHGQDLFPVLTHDRVGALLHRDRALRVVAQGDTRHTDDRGLLLQPAGVRHDQACTGYQAQHLQVTQRLQAGDALVFEHGLQAQGLHAIAGTRMHGEDDRQPFADLANRLQEVSEQVGIIHIGRPVQGQHAIPLAALQEPFPVR